MRKRSNAPSLYRYKCCPFRKKHTHTQSVTATTSATHAVLTSTQNNAAALAIPRNTDVTSSTFKSLVVYRGTGKCGGLSRQ